MSLPPGKLDHALLARLLAANPIEDERVVIRPAVGRDVCAIRFGERYLVAKTDPITFATERIGWYLVHVNANDLATVGARPRWLLVTCLLPEDKTDEALVESIWNDLQAAVREVGCALCGGHTEVTAGLDRPILVGLMLGEVEADRFVDKTGARPGDRILLTKGVPVEGTAILAREWAGRLRPAFDEEDIARAAAFLEDPGISVLKEAMAACEAGGVHAMHDPTEGGLLCGLWELAEATGCGLRADLDRVPLLEPGASMCRHLGLDPLGTISSGTLLICAEPASAGRVRAAVEAAGVRCVEIGRLTPPHEGRRIVREGREVELQATARDELARLA